METKDTQIEGLEEICERVYGVKPTAPSVQLLREILKDQAIALYIPAVKALQEEVERLKDAKHKLCAGILDREQRIATLESQLAGGEAVAWQVRFYHTDNGDPGWSSWQDCTKQEFILYGGYTAPKCEVRKLYTAPAIKQQVADGWREAIDELMDFSPDNRGPLPGMIRGGEYVRKDEVISALERIAAPTQPVSANQPDSAEKVPPGYALVPLRLTPAMLDILDQDDWQWEDVLAAAEAITEEQYNEIAASPSAPIAEGEKQ